MSIKMSLPVGDTIQEMRANISGTPLQRMGDARLMWVNEGDLASGQVWGRVEILTNLKERQDERK